MMRYIDISDEAEINKFPTVVAILKTKSVSSLPLVAFDGIPIWLGSLSYVYLMDELKKRGIEPVA